MLNSALNGLALIPFGMDKKPDIQLLRERSELLWTIRQYFRQQQVIEVETPLLRRFGVSDPHLSNLRLAPSAFVSHTRYLQTSPESALKILLSQGSGSLYQLAKVFRDDPEGNWHRQEFTLLEWYRVDFDLITLIEDIKRLLAVLNLPIDNCRLTSYRDAFVEHAGLDPFRCATAELREFVREKIDDTFAVEQRFAAESRDALERDLLLDVIMSHVVQPKLGANGFEFLINYPVSQAALAKLGKDREGLDVALRAELFFAGVELANAYDELLDLQEFESRYQCDCEIRRALGLPEVEIDAGLQSAMQAGLPACAGVALGIDRLFSVWLAHAGA